VVPTQCERTFDLIDFPNELPFSLPVKTDFAACPGLYY